MQGIDLAGIGSLASVLTGLLVTVGSLMLQRQRRQAVDADDLEDELEIRTEQFRAAMRLITRHEDDRASFTDLPPLPRPRQLRSGYFQDRTTKGKRRRADRYAEDDGAPDPDSGGGADDGTGSGRADPDGGATGGRRRRRAAPE